MTCHVGVGIIPITNRWSGMDFWPVWKGLLATIPPEAISLACRPVCHPNEKSWLGGRAINDIPIKMVKPWTLGKEGKIHFGCLPPSWL